VPKLHARCENHAAIPPTQSRFFFVNLTLILVGSC
jgi:hypothetical protein